MRFASVDGGAEDIAVLEHHRAEVTADADGDGLAFDFQFRMDANVMLHCGCRR